MLMFIWAFIVLLVLNLNNLPLVWHYRFFRALGAGIIVRHKARNLFQPNHVFLAAVSVTRSALMEGDFNLHKSNSTYFTDLDVSRAYLAGITLGRLFLSGINGRRCNLIVGAVACSFRREIKLYQAYETWTKIASWDDKWIYMVTHFVSHQPSALPINILELEAEKSSENPREMFTQGSKHTNIERVVLASAVTQFICKQGKKTVRPTHALAVSGMLNPTSAGYEQSLLLSSGSFFNNVLQLKDKPTELGTDIPPDIEARRKKNLPIVQLQSGWEKVYQLFQPEEAILGFS